jgi:5,6-dimethylbenzimidazole synthase
MPNNDDLASSAQRAPAFPDLWRHGVYEAIARRRDMRQFLPDPIPPEVLARILMAAHQAGSVGFMQPWNFLVIEDLPTRQAIRRHVDEERLKAAESFEGDRREKYLSFKLEGIVDAPVNICVTCDPSRHGPVVIGRNTIRETDIYSTCGAVQNLWLAARAEGVGVGWVSILDPARLRALLHIPPAVTPVAYLCLGYVKEFPERPMLETAGWLPRLPLDGVVHAERFGQAVSGPLAEALRAEAARQGTAAPATSLGKQPGLLLVYTGTGKGKTTAAMGLVARALGRGMPVAVVQFIKGKWKTGERLFAETLPNLTFLVMGCGFTWESDDLSRDKQAAALAWHKAKGLILDAQHFAVVLDEISYAILYGFIDLQDVLETINRRPAGVHVVVTGRNVPQEIIDAADLVTEMRSVKHPFEKGIKAQAGIDY